MSDPAVCNVVSHEELRVQWAELTAALKEKREVERLQEKQLTVDTAAVDEMKAELLRQVKEIEPSLCAERKRALNDSLVSCGAFGYYWRCV